MPNIRHNAAYVRDHLTTHHIASHVYLELTRDSPKILNLKYSYDREQDWISTPPALHRQVSRETSYASIRSPASVAFPHQANVGSTVPPPSPGYFHRHKSSNFSTGPGGSTDWSSRQGWTPVSATAQPRVQSQGQGQGQSRGGHVVYGHGYAAHAHDSDAELDYGDAHLPFKSRFPDTDPSSVTF